MEKKFERSMSDKKIWGVCSGLSKYFGISNPWILRIVLLVLTAFVGVGPIAYIILRFVMKPDNA
ncbi:MAG: PspC domain-containing protein [Eubacteriales bacterium]